ncbi:MAG: hypothetical protein RL240_103, partial [Planctomycetota bacterium]
MGKVFLSKELVRCTRHAGLAQRSSSTIALEIQQVKSCRLGRVTEKSRD